MALIVGYPVWWALGMTVFVYPLLAVPMVFYLLRRRRLAMPPGFGIWILFLVWVAAGLVTLGLTAPGTHPGSVAGRLIPYGMRLVGYLAVTVVLLYIGNLTERELPRTRIVKMLSGFAIVTIAGGVLGVAWPTFGYTSPVELLLPQRVAESSFVQVLVHPSSAQVMYVFGYDTPRPKAPFEYTNTWGNCLAVLLIWLVVGWWVYGSRRKRWACGAALGVAAVPIVYSLNRGLWVALGLAVLYLVFRLAARGRLVALASLAGPVIVLGVLVLATPLYDVIELRLANPHSDEGRISASLAAINAASGSPVLGYGSTRDAVGSGESIAIGASADCPRCGITIGGNGQLWLLLISNGYVGAALYIAFFANAIWRYRRDVSPIGLGGLFAVGLALLFMPIYSALTAPLFLYLVSLGLLWRNDIHQRETETTSSAQEEPSVPPVASVRIS